MSVPLIPLLYVLHVTLLLATLILNIHWLTTILKIHHPQILIWVVPDTSLLIGADLQNELIIQFYLNLLNTLIT